MIERSLVILAWQDHLKPEWMPPEWMWHLDDELEEHFEWVKQERDEGTDDDDVDVDEDTSPSRRRKPDRVVPLEGNAFSQGRGRNS